LRRPHPKSTLFPYTTLFRSESEQPKGGYQNETRKEMVAIFSFESLDEDGLSFDKNNKLVIVDDSDPDWWIAYKSEEPEKRGYIRSEEHTSELQSRFDLVCRL